MAEFFIGSAAVLGGFLNTTTLGHDYS